ncbi:MAG: helix-turn-helix domain-containing protein [Candidatus Bathyarchaeota archaeon]
MNLERIIETLTTLGLSIVDAEVYVCIAKNGPKSVKDLDESLKYSKNQISKSLKKLTAITLVNNEEPLFSAMPFEEALELLIAKQREQEKTLKETKKQLLEQWNDGS